MKVDRQQQQTVETSLNVGFVPKINSTAPVFGSLDPPGGDFLFCFGVKTFLLLSGVDASVGLLPSFLKKLRIEPCLLAMLT